MNLYRSIARMVLALALFGQTPAFAQHPDFPELDPLPALDSVPEYALPALARRLADQAGQIRDVFVRKAERAALEREVVADQLAASVADTLAPPEERKILERALKAAKEVEKAAFQEVAKADKVLASVEKLAEQEGETLRKSLPKANKQVAALIPKPEPEETPIANIIGVQGVSEPGNTPLPGAPDTTAVDANAAPAPPKPAPRPQFKKYDPTTDVLLYPPPRPCVLTVDTRDEFSGERRREVQKEELFRFTSPSLKAYLQDRDHIVCHAWVTIKGSASLLNLQFQINDANAKRAFGSLPKNGVAILKLLDGETLTLYNLRTDEGVVGSDKISHAYTGQYAIDPGMLKKLQKTLLDKVRIAWSTGYEDYDAHHVDLLTRQLGCLLK